MRCSLAPIGHAGDVQRVLVVPDEELDPRVRTAARTLLDAAFEGRFDHHDWDHTCGGLRVLLVDDEQLLAHAALVPRRLRVGRRWFTAGYVEGVAATPRRRGLGTAVMRGVDRAVHAGYELGALSTGEHGFYERLGWERWRGPTSVIDGDRDARTPDDDDGVMVLRTAATSAIDLDAAIACESRTGDVW
jgi:aminoglycoside 2'-N-acetyltransferase I